MKTFINFLLSGCASLDAFQVASRVFLQSSIVSLLYVSFSLLEEVSRLPILQSSQ